MPILSNLSLVRDLSIDYGIPYHIVFNVSEIDLTGATGTGVIASEPGEQIVAKFNVDIDVISTVLSQITLSLTEADTVIATTPAVGKWLPNLFYPGNWWWNLRFDYSDPDKLPEYFLGGAVSVRQRI